MPPKAPVPGSPQDWLRHARSDLALACGGRSGLILHEHLCFHAQQAVEKALKAVLLASRITPPRTHDIGHQLTLLPATMSQPAAVRASAVLTKYAVQARYPADWDEISPDDFAQSLKLAVAVLRWAAAQLRKRPARGAELFD